MSSLDLTRAPIVFRGREHSEVAIPLSYLLENGRLHLFEEVKGRKFFQIYSKGTELIFQCGGFIGLIPVNECVAIDVAPRVDISNVDRILQKAGTPHQLINLITRGYAGRIETGYLVDVLADALCSTIDDIIDWGKHKEYERVVTTGLPRSGRMLIKDTLRARGKFPGLPVAVTARHERSVNNALNCCIRLALERLIRLLQRTRNASGVEKARLSRLNISWLSFRDVMPAESEDYIVHEAEHCLSLDGGVSPPYKKAVPLSIAVLRSLGPSQRNLPPSFHLGSLVFDLAGAFESYVRKCLQEKMHWRVLDGNLAKPVGAKTLLFSNSTHQQAKTVVATPDIVVNDENSRPAAVFDAKYKPYLGLPDRADINQVLTYAVLYGVKTCGIVFPATQPEGLTEHYGKVGDIDVFGVSISLGAADLAAEEKRFSEAVNALLS